MELQDQMLKLCSQLGQEPPLPPVGLRSPMLSPDDASSARSNPIGSSPSVAFTDNNGFPSPKADVAAFPPNPRSVPLPERKSINALSEFNEDVGHHSEEIYPLGVDGSTVFEWRERKGSFR